jgi:hypothetical protein
VAKQTAKIDLDNFLNTVKRVIPEFTDFAAGFVANESNFMQSEMDALLTAAPIRDAQGLSPMESFFLVKES